MRKNNEKTRSKHLREPMETADSSSHSFLGMTTREGFRHSSREEPCNENPSHEVIEVHAVGYPPVKRRGEAAKTGFVARVSGFDFRVAKSCGLQMRRPPVRCAVCPSKG
jgi:hypothetical protein